MFSRGSLFALAVVVLTAGCPANECLQSADIQVTVVPDPTIDPAAIASLHVALSVNGAPAKSLVITPKQTIDKNGTAFILRPDSAPAKATYSVTVTIEAMNSAGVLFAIGSNTAKVLAKGCNQLTTYLAGLPPDMPSTVLDLSLPPGVDGLPVMPSDMFTMSGPPDMAGCVGGMPDEDNDGRANNCDLCPADYDPTPSDSDGDGLPDQCDPDPSKAGNRLVYFDPFDAASGHWTGNFTVPMGMSFLQIDSKGPTDNPVSVANIVDKVPVNVRVQTFVVAPGYYSDTSQPLAVMALFLGDGPDPFQPGTNGALCQIRFDTANGDAVRLRAVVNGTLGPQTQTPMGNCNTATLPPPPQFCFQNKTLYRLRLTQRGAVYNCEVIDLLGNSYAPAALTATAPAGPTQTVVLQETNLQAQFHSVVVETALSP